MAKLVWVGPNLSNRGGNSSKGYVIRRRGPAVVVRYGPVEVLGGGGGRYHWRRRPTKVVHRFRSKDRAKSFLIRQCAAKERAGYDRLPGRVKIRSIKRRTKGDR